ncbi:MAG TPA: transaldolase family protein [Gemmatimonadaceae bacterium]|nr:transaldolase family protein [Gemmatimonadaceae bacterium]
MRIYLESVNLDEIRNVAAAGLADGVAFSHVAFSADAPDASAIERLEEISREFAFPVCVPVGAVTSGDIYTEARELAKVSDHIVVQIPLVEDSLIPISRLSAEGVVVCATFVFDAAQAIIAAKAGATTVRVSLDDLERYGQSGARALAEIKNVLEAGERECDVMAASPRSAVQFAECALAGADVISLTPDTLRALVVHPLSDKGVDKFLSDLAKRPKSRSSA